MCSLGHVQGGRFDKQFRMFEENAATTVIPFFEDPPVNDPLLGPDRRRQCGGLLALGLIYLSNHRWLRKRICL